MSAAFDTAAALGVVPVIAIESVEHAVPLADALLEAGLGLAEITFRTDAALEVMARLRDARPELLVGAGTVLSAEALRQAQAAGARFALAPGYDPAVLDAAEAIGLPFAPGVMTPSDLTAVLGRGLRLAKFFPADAAGGPAMLSSITAPFAHLQPRFIPTGGVTEANLAQWLALPSVVAVGGTWIARPEAMRAGQWDQITRTARAALAAVQAARAGA